MFSAFPLSGAPFAGIPQTNIAFEVTGVSASGAIGTVKTGIAVQPSGVSSVVYLNDAIAQANADVPVTGVEAVDNAIGTVTIYLQKFVDVVGVQAANDVGTVEIDAKGNTDVTGVEAIFATDFSVDLVVGKANVFPTGVTGTGELGEAEIDSKATVYPTGVNASVSLGVVIPSSDNIITVTGFALTASLGEEGTQADANAVVTGVAGTIALGTVEIDSKATVYLTGISASCNLREGRNVNVWGLVNTA